MSQQRLSLTRAESCANSALRSRKKGGTIIAEDVWSLKEHLRRLCNADLYRPGSCRSCGERKLHVHDRLERHPLGVVLAVAVVVVLRFICVNPNCRATWQVLPAWLPRGLWRAWHVVEHELDGELVGACAGPALASCPAPDPSTPRWQQSAGTQEARDGPAQQELPERNHAPIPARTSRRWLARIKASACSLVVLLASRGTRSVRAVAERVGRDACRATLACTYAAFFGLSHGVVLAALAALIDRLSQGLRLM